jgi:hypothetical protein
MGSNVKDRCSMVNYALLSDSIFAQSQMQPHY